MASKKLIPQKLKMVITIVNKSKAQFYLDYLEGFGVNMQLSLDGEGTAPLHNSLIWGFEHRDREVIISFVAEDKVKHMLKKLEGKFESIKKGEGIAFSVPISSIIGVAVYQFLIDSRKKKEIKK